MQASIERKAVKRSHTLNPRDSAPSIQQQHTRVAVDARPRDHLVSVARDDSDVKAVVTGAHINVRVPGRVREHHPLIGVRRGVELNPGPHQTRQPRVGMLAQRTERHLRARVPRTRFTRQAVPLAHERDMRGIQPIRH